MHVSRARQDACPDRIGRCTRSSKPLLEQALPLRALLDSGEEVHDGDTQLARDVLAGLSVFGRVLVHSFVLRHCILLVHLPAHNCSTNNNGTKASGVPFTFWLADSRQKECVGCGAPPPRLRALLNRRIISRPSLAAPRAGSRLEMLWEMLIASDGQKQNRAGARAWCSLVVSEAAWGVHWGGSE